MQCPNCGKTDNKVIDSRLSKDGIAIRRRRQCLICSSRFSTYESSEEQLLPFLIRKKTGRETITRNLKNFISFNSTAFKDLAKGIETLIDQVDKLEKSQATKEPKVKPARPKPKSLKKAPVKKTPVKKIVLRAKPIKKTVAKKAKKVSAIDTVLSIIKKSRSKKGVDTATLKKKTGFDDKKIWNVINSLKKQGKIKNPNRGFYII